MLKQFTREEKSWIFYDWANSAQSAIVAAIILPIFFKSMARAGGVSDVDATAYWGYATSLGTLICALLRCAARYMSWALRGRLRPPARTPRAWRPVSTQCFIVCQTSER